MPDDSSTTTSLLRQVAQGRKAAIDACLSAFGPIIWSLARRHLKNLQDAEDAVQEIFVSLWRNAGRFDPDKGSEKSFVLTIARRRLIDRLRKEGRQPAMQEILPDAEPADSPPPDLVEIEDEKERVMTALAALRPEQRQVLEMALISGQTQQEIADLTGMPVGTVKSHARRGLIRVREMLRTGGGT